MKFHLDLAHHYWKKKLKPGGTAIDATLGNGHDTFFLAKILEGRGKIVSYDIQKEAIENAKVKLHELSEDERAIITFHNASHETFFEKEADLIVYNLGYLPGSDKTVTTQTASTLKSVEDALAIAKAISITCYPGHEEGSIEEKALLSFLGTLPYKKWEISFHHLLNRDRAPSLIWIEQRP